jgi:D-psicose/D-tagatose/L-ribulose 3-epimerase
MCLAVSNIAWPVGADAEAALLLREQGATGVELALTKVWSDPLAASAVEVARCRRWWEARGLRVVALQALLFGKPELVLFGTPAARRATIEYLRGIIGQAARLGARALVFGSPGNRKRGALPWAEARAIAVAFFHELGEAARDCGVTLCIEPNPAEYGCDFVTGAAEAIDLVDVVASPGFAVHLDSAALTLAGDGPAGVAAAGERCRHFHASTPFLAGVPGGGVDHAGLARALAAQHYRGWVSIEMSESRLQPNWQEGVRRALVFVRDTYARVLAVPAPATRAG